MVILVTRLLSIIDALMLVKSYRSLGIESYSNNNHIQNHVRKGLRLPKSPITPPASPEALSPPLTPLLRRLQWFCGLARKVYIKNGAQLAGYLSLALQMKQCQP
jgi:hypothetical protein